MNLQSEEIVRLLNMIQFDKKENCRSKENQWEKLVKTLYSLAKSNRHIEIKQTIIEIQDFWKNDLEKTTDLNIKKHLFYDVGY